ncbi:hypothetical protein [Bacillus xiamenensis]|uniref:hypothetical protein n=1 Tax=Bacillus xiamenensis TaxID=1178537 RepID=UPI0012DC8B42|nr:hypothetical protein [Bacillus xiamenensis]
MTTNEIKSNENTRYIKCVFDVKDLLEDETRIEMFLQSFKTSIQIFISREKAKLAGESK